MKSEIAAKIEKEIIIGEVSPGGYQPIRFTRIKYKACSESHIDIRKFQRGYDEEGEEAWYPTKIGFRFLEHEFNRIIRSYTITPEIYLHPSILKSCGSLLEQREYESAVLKAFKLLESRTRTLIGGSSEDYGVSLLRKAFHPKTGALTDKSIPVSEREAFSNYLSGAFGYYKNPCSHREVVMTFKEAFKSIVVASDLLTIVESRGVDA